MHRTGVVVAAVVGFSVLSAAWAADQAQREPPLEFSVTIDGQEVAVNEGDQARVKLGDREVVIKVDVKPERLLRAPGVSFRYPRHYAFSHEAGEPTIWTMDGNDHVLMLQRYDGQIDVAALRQQLADEMEKLYKPAGTTRRGKTSLKLAGVDYAGERIVADIATTRIQQDIFTFAAGGATYALITQDTPKDDGSSTDEAKSAVELLTRSFQLGD